MVLNHGVSAVVAGGASGMGEATVRALRACAVNVSILDQNVVRGNAVAAATGSLFVAVDVTDEASVLSGFQQVRAVNGQERIYIHTPGGGGLGHTAWRDPQSGVVRRHDFKRFSRIVELNLHGTFLCASVAAAGMMTLTPNEDGERGSIVMTSSTASQDAPAGTIAYVASKAAINGMTLAMARDLAPEGIRVNTILPGNFATSLLDGVPKDYKQQMISWQLHPKRFGDAAEYASFALELVRNGYFNAATARLDAGARV